MQKELLRKLNKIETAVFLAHNALNSHVTPFARLSIRGSIDEKRLQQSLPLVQQQHPLLQCAILEGPCGLAFYKITPMVPIVFKVLPKTDPEHWSMLASTEIQKKFSVETGELVRLFLLKDEQGQTHDLVAIFHHSVADLISMAAFYESLLHFYTVPNERGFKVEDEERVFHPYKESVSHYFKHTSSNFLARFKKLMTTLQDGVRYLMGIRYFRWHHQEQYKHQFGFIFANLTQAETQSLFKLCKQQDVSLTGLFAAVYLKMLQEQVQLKKFYSWVPINMRGYFSPPLSIYAMGCYIDTYQKLPCEITDKNVWVVAKEISENITREALSFIFKTPDVPNSKILQRAYFLLLKTKAWLDNIFNQDQIGMSLINYGGQLIIHDTPDFSIQAFSWSGNDGLAKYNRDQNYVLSFAELNHQLQITFSTNLSVERAQKLFNNFLSQLKNL